VENVSNWIDEAKRNLEAGDKIVKTYPCKLNGEFGYLTLSGKKIQFIAQKGFLSKTYSKKFEVAYDKIRKLEQKDPYTIELLDGENAAKIINFNELPARIVMESLNQLMQPAH
jgi:hypothetical protein